MKFFFLFLILILANCAVQTSAIKSDNTTVNNSIQPNSAVKNTSQVHITVGNFTPLTAEESAKINEDKRREEIIQNDKLKDVPDALKKVDFENFSYPYKFSYNRKKISISLKKDGNYTYEFQDDRGWFDFKDVFFVDLTGDGKKEAIVLLWHVSCGASCDGGSGLFYIYSTEQSKPNLLWQFETGSFGYGLGLKSFTVRNKKITIEEFGECSAEEQKIILQCGSKFSAKDVIRITFGFKGGGIVQESKETIATPISNVKHYRSKISIEE